MEDLLCIHVVYIVTFHKQDILTERTNITIIESI